MEALNLFPTTIWRHNLDHLSEYYDKWTELLNERRKVEEEGQGRSTRHGWSGPKTLFKDPEFQPLRLACREAYATVLRSMKLPENFRFALEAWGNIQDPGGYNKLHIHREAIISGVFYIDVPEGSGAIAFMDPRPGALYSRPFRHPHNSYKEILMQPKRGVLLIFPNWLQHSVEPNLSESSRYSIAVNAIFPNRS